MHDKLSDNLYGDDHELIGVPCLFKDGCGQDLPISKLRPAIPFGSFKHPDTGKPKLTIWFLDCNGKTKAMAGVDPCNLVSVDRFSKDGRVIFNMVLSNMKK